MAEEHRQARAGFGDVHGDAVGVDLACDVNSDIATVKADGVDRRPERCRSGRGYAAL